MIPLLDTTVVSELMRPQPSPAVQAWMARAPAVAFHVASISVAEILYGIARLPEGRRKEALADQACTAGTCSAGSTAASLWPSARRGPLRLT